jgi:pyruvate dehydrogenase E1 component
MAVTRRSRHSRASRDIQPGCESSSRPKPATPIVAASDYVSAVADLIRPWIADPYLALGTDGFGRSDTRAALRRFFEVDRHSIAVAALGALGDARARDAARRYGLDSDRP